MIRRFALVATTALALAPVAVQAAPQRLAAPVSAEAEELRAGSFLIPLAIVIAITLGILLLVDDSANAFPASP